MKKHSIFIFLILFIISFLVIFVFSTSTSPLYKNYYEDDSAIFIVVGKSILSGKTLYKDIFDHKGPILFFIEALGQLIFDGRFGIFVLQIISLTITNLFLFKISNLFVDKKKSIFSVFFSMSMLICFFEEGNLSEEFSLPFLSISLYLALKWVISKNCAWDKFTKYYATTIGICFAIISLIRLNNAAIIIGLLLGITIILLKNKYFSDFLKSILYFTIGIAIIYIPICIYFYKNNALYDMFYGTFIHNFMYVKNRSAFSLLEKLYYMLHILVLMICTFKSIYKNKNLFTIIFTSTIITVLTLFIGKAYSHYYIITIPLVPIFISYILIYADTLETNLKKFIYVILTTVAIIYTLSNTLRSIYYFVSLNTATVSQIQELSSYIPEVDKNSILSYNNSISGSIYLYGDFLPCYKYAFLQSYLIKSNKNIENEILNEIESKNIKWLFSKNIINAKNKTNIDNKILENYEFVDSIIVKRLDYLNLVDEEICLYKLK